MEEKQVVEYKARDGSTINLTPAIIKRYLVSGKAEFVNDQELFIYMGLCKSRGLNPFIKDCHLVKYTPGEPAAIITSIDYYRKRARAQQDCKGWKTGVIVLQGEGRLCYREGCIVLEGEQLVGGWCEGKPDGWESPMRKEVNLKRYVKKTKEGNTTRFWSEENQPEMIAKVAESQLLRALWPDEFQGLYVDSEMQSHEAQATLNRAVATPSEEPEAPAFDEVFADLLKDPLFAEFGAASTKLYKLTQEELWDEFAKQPDKIRRLFADWKKRAIETAGPEPAHTPTPDSTKPRTWRDEWINLKAQNFGKFVQANLEKFNAADFITRSEAAQKWVKLYQAYPCPIIMHPGKQTDAEPSPEIPPTDQPEPAGETIEPEQAQSHEDQHAAELLALQTEIKEIEREHLPYVLQSKKELGMVLQASPTSIDGCQVLLERVRAMLQERPPKNGK